MNADEGKSKSTTMKRFDGLSLVVYGLKLMRAVPCLLLLKPFPCWLQSNLHFYRIAATGVPVNSGQEG